MISCRFTLLVIHHFQKFLFCSYEAHAPDLYSFLQSSYTPLEWFHVVLNLLGPEPDAGIRAYHDGQILDNSGFHRPQVIQPNEVGQIVIGKLTSTGASMENFDFYASVMVDELLLFEQSLNDTQILALSRTGT